MAIAHACLHFNEYMVEIYFRWMKIDEKTQRRESISILTLNKKEKEKEKKKEIEKEKKRETCSNKLKTKSNSSFHNFLKNKRKIQ